MRDQGVNRITRKEIKGKVLAHRTSTLQNPGDLAPESGITSPGKRARRPREDPEVRDGRLHAGRYSRVTKA